MTSIGCAEISASWASAALVQGSTSLPFFLLVERQSGIEREGEWSELHTLLLLQSHISEEDVPMGKSTT